MQAKWLLCAAALWSSASREGGDILDQNSPGLIALTLLLQLGSDHRIQPVSRAHATQK